MLNPESPYNHLLFKNKRYVSKLESFFHAPQTGKYRFWLTANYEAKLYMNAARPNEILDRNADEMPQIVSSKESGLRDIYGLYNEKTGTFDGRSDWVFLDKDSYYHMELWHDNGGFNEHFTLGVEMEQDQAQSNSRYEIQRVSYRTESWTPAYYFKLAWDGIDYNQRFTITFDHFQLLSGTHTPYEVSNLKVGFAPWEFKAYFESYMWKEFGIIDDFQVEVHSEMSEDGQDLVALELSIIFPQGVLGNPLHQPFVTRANEIAPETSGEAVYDRGTGGFSGRLWKLDIYDLDSQQMVTINNLAQDVAAWVLEERMAEEVPHYFQRVKVVRNNLYERGGFIGYEWVFTFFGLIMDFPQFRAQDINIPNGVFRSETVLDYSTNIFLYPAPYSLFYSVSDKPQLTVEVDGYRGVCSYEHTWHEGCTFVFEDPLPKVTSYWSEEPYAALTIHGEDLDVLEISYITHIFKYALVSYRRERSVLGKQRRGREGLFTIITGAVTDKLFGL